MNKYFASRTLPLATFLPFLAAALLIVIRPAAANPVYIDSTIPLDPLDPASFAKFIPPLILVTAVLEFVIARWTFKSDSIFITVFIANALSVPPTQIAAKLLSDARPDSYIYPAAELIPLAVEFAVYRLMRNKMAAAGIDAKYITNENFFTTVVLANIASYACAGGVLSLFYGAFQMYAAR